MACVGTAILLCLIVFFCYKRNKKLEYKYSRLQHQAARHQRSSAGSGNNSSSSSFLGNSGSTSTAHLVAGQHHDHDDSGDVDCETEMAAAES